MIHTIANDYSSWLGRYIEQKECVYKPLASLLLKQLRHVKSIDELHAVLIDAKRQPHYLSFFNQNPNDPFTIQLTQRLQTVVQVQELYTLQTHTKIKGISAKGQGTALIDLLNEVLTDPRTLMHRLAITLLRFMQDMGKLQKMVSHLESQPPKTAPLDPKPGSFDAMAIYCAQQAACVDLLRNNAATLDFKNNISTGSNSFLQTLLCIYNDINTPALEVKMESCATTRWCVIS